MIGVAHRGGEPAGQVPGWCRRGVELQEVRAASLVRCDALDLALFHGPSLPQCERRVRPPIRCRARGRRHDLRRQLRRGVRDHRRRAPVHPPGRALHPRRPAAGAPRASDRTAAAAPARAGVGVAVRGGARRAWCCSTSAVVRGSAHAEPAVIGVAVAAVPLVLAVGGPLTAGSAAGGRRSSSGPASSRRALRWSPAAAGPTSPGSAGRRWCWPGRWRSRCSRCRCCAGSGRGRCRCTRCGSPRRRWRCSRWSSTGRAPCSLDAADLLAAAHLAVFVTALAFVLWYGAVDRIGAARAGLFTGVVPVTAAVGGVLLGARPRLPWCGRAWRWSRSGWASACPRESARCRRESALARRSADSRR